jgi:predicted acylesterase/phospholipase RssA
MPWSSYGRRRTHAGSSGAGLRGFESWRRSSSTTPRSLTTPCGPFGQSLPVGRFEETTIPLSVVASDLASGTSRLLSSGDLLEAVLASSAIPGLFPPVEIDGERLVDGAIADPLPIAALLRRGIRRVAVVEAGRPCGCVNDLGHATSLFQRAVTVVMRDRMNLLLRLVPPEVELLSLGLVCRSETPITDLSHAALRAQLGYEEGCLPPWWIRHHTPSRSPIHPGGLIGTGI